MNELNGLNSDFGLSDQYTGYNGDGSTESGDLLTQILNSKTVEAAAAAGVTALIGGQKVQYNGNGTYQQIPASQQGGNIGAQVSTVSWTQKIPMGAWIAGGVLFFVGLLALLSGGRR